MEVADDVLLLHPPEEPLEQEPGDRGHDLAQADAALLPHAVDRPRRVVAHAAVPDVQVDEQVVGEAVARVEAVEVEQAQRLERDGGVAGLRVGHLPVAGRDLREEGEDGVAEVAVARDQLPGLAGEEAVGLGVVALAGGDALDQGGEVVGIHLVVRGHDARDVDRVVARVLVAGDDGGADAGVHLVPEHLDARVGLGGATHGRVLGAVVDDDDPVDERGDAAHGLGHELLLVVGRDDDGDGLPLVHATRIGGREGPLEGATPCGGGKPAPRGGRRARRARSPGTRRRRPTSSRCGR